MADGVGNESQCVSILLNCHRSLVICTAANHAYGRHPHRTTDEALRRSDGRG